MLHGQVKVKQQGAEREKPFTSDSFSNALRRQCHDRHLSGQVFSQSAQIILVSQASISLLLAYEVIARSD